MKKNIKLEIAIGIILVIVFILSGTFWLNNESIQKTSKEKNEISNNSVSTHSMNEVSWKYKHVKILENGQWEVKEVEPKDWQKPLLVEKSIEYEIMNTWEEYKDEKLGIEFKYPQSWDVSNNEEKINLYIKSLADARDYMENALHDRTNIFPERASIECTRDEKKIADRIKWKAILEKGSSLDASNNELIELDGSVIFNTQKTNIEIADNNPIIFYDYANGDGAGHFAEAFWERNGLRCKALMPGSSVEGLTSIEQSGRVELFKKILATFRFTK
jgi:hypothetical protein